MASRKRDDGAVGGVHDAELLVSTVSWLKARTSAGTSARSRASSPLSAALTDALIALVLQVGVPLGGGVARNASLDGEVVAPTA